MIKHAQATMQFSSNGKLTGIRLQVGIEGVPTDPNCIMFHAKAMAGFLEIPESNIGDIHSSHANPLRGHYLAESIDGVVGKIRADLKRTQPEVL
jgi:hypothetical protein